MKSFKVRVQNDKVQFFRELLKNLDFVDFEEVEGFHEPRVYPGANFEIHSKSGKKNIEEKKLQNISSEDNGLDSIRSVLNKIEEQRNRNKNRI